MADIISDLDKINDIEVAFNAPVTEALFEKIGANINALIDEYFENVITFTANGTWTCPENKTRILVGACGGGGGGGNSSLGGGFAEIRGAGGGAAAAFQFYLLDVVPLTIYNITIGAGGTGPAGRVIGGGAGDGNMDGGDGGSTLFDTLLTFRGGRGGIRGLIPTVAGAKLGLSVTTGSGADAYRSGGEAYSGGANGGDFGYINWAGEDVPGARGQGSTFFNGGIGGANVTSGTVFTGGGGGGASIFGAGGAGGAGKTSGPANNGVAASATAYGAGGGGGGGVGALTGAGGGAGAPGILKIYY